MRKKELENIPVMPIRDVKRQRGKYVIMAHISELSNSEKVLVAEIYFSLNKDPNHRVFITEKNDITLELNCSKRGWKTGKLYQYTAWYQKDKWIEHEESRKVIAEFTKCADINMSSNRMINDFQDNIREQKLKEKYRKITDPWDEVMKKIPEEPEDLKQWISEYAMGIYRYIFYQYTGKKQQHGWCSHCGQEVMIENAISGQQGVCPNCGSTVILKSGKKSNYKRDEKNIFLMQRVEEKIIVRKFIAVRSIRKEKEQWIVHDSYYEYARMFFEQSGKINDTYIREYFKQRETRWVKHTDVGGSYLGNGSLYPKNLDEVLKDTIYRYVGIKEMAEYELGFSFNLGKLLPNIQDYPYIEYLNKNRLCRIAADCLEGIGVSPYCARYATKVSTVNESANTLDKLLRVEKYDIRFLQDNKANMTGLEYLQEKRKRGEKPHPEHMKFIQELFHTKLEEFDKFTRYAKPGKVIKYLKKNKRQTLERKRGYIKLWEDYIQMAEQLRYDLTNDFVMFPRYLQLRHDQCIQLLEEEKERKKINALKKESKKIKKMFDEITKLYAMTYKGLMIVVPSAAGDIIKEGHDMHHCVGGYVTKVANGDTTILFIRKTSNPEESYYTMEVRNGEVIQCRGKYNAAMTPDVNAFVQRFKKDKLNTGKRERKAG